jgi:vacuolar-type H+-ATPase subunit F/Vma7
VVTPTKRLGLAVIGGEDLVNGMRLAGITRCRVVADDRQAGAEIREALAAFVDDPAVAIIVIQDEHAAAVAAELARLREARRHVPVVLPVPSRHGTRQGDARQYYREVLRKFIGFDIEV